MRISEKAQAHLLDVYLAEETEAVFKVLNKTDLQTLAAMPDSDIELFIKDRTCRHCLLAGGYIEKRE